MRIYSYIFNIICDFEQLLMHFEQSVYARYKFNRDI